MLPLVFLTSSGYGQYCEFLLELPDSCPTLGVQTSEGKLAPSRQKNSGSREDSEKKSATRREEVEAFPTRLSSTEFATE